jgi:hypothetical protein
VVDLLVLVKAFVNVALARAGAPEDVPLVALRGTESVSLEQRPQQLVVKTEHLVKQLTVLYVIRLCPVVITATTAEIVGRHLVLLDVFKLDTLVLLRGGHGSAAEAGRARATRAIEEAGVGSGARATDGGLSGCLIEAADILLGGNGVCSLRPMRILLELLQLSKDLIDLALPVLFLSEGLRDDESALLVDEVGGTDPARDLTVDPVPLAFEVRLNLLEPI